MCAEGPWFAPGYGRGDGLKLYCYTHMDTIAHTCVHAHSLSLLSPSLIPLLLSITPHHSLSPLPFPHHKHRPSSFFYKSFLRSLPMQDWTAPIVVLSYPGKTAPIVVPSCPGQTGSILVPVPSWTDPLNLSPSPLLDRAQRNKNHYTCRKRERERRSQEKGGERERMEIGRRD